jgi:hypothetical protein
MIIMKTNNPDERNEFDVLGELVTNLRNIKPDNNPDEAVQEIKSIEGWPIADYRLEMWNGLPHPNRASELLCWVADLTPNEYLRVESLAASRTVQALVAQVEKYKTALEDFASEDCCLTLYPQQFNDGRCRHCIATDALKEKP